MKDTIEARAFGGLFTRRARWGLSATGWLALAVAVLLSGILLMRTVFPFLAVTDRVPADVLVVEGWIHTAEIGGVVAEFATGDYQHVFTTGGPVSGTGGYTNDFNTSASVGADRLRAAGVPADRVVMVPSRVMARDRTYGAAIALRDFLRAHNMSPTRLNVATEAPHARRTRLLFQKALGPNIEVGIIAIPNPDYNSERWWEYSEGVKDIFSEGLAYLYAKFVFFPC